MTYLLDANVWPRWSASERSPFMRLIPCPPIEMEEIHLITWIAIERANGEGAG